MDLKWKVGFAIAAAAGFVVLLFSLYEVLIVVYLIESWFQVLIAFSIVSIVLILFKYWFSKIEMDSVTVFEKTLQGELYHFKCQRCYGVFAVKESRKNDIHLLTLTCPICGSIGRISPHPPRLIDRIPTEKSPCVSFLCKTCNERLNIWAEGATLSEEIFIFSCPYCGSKRQMKRQL